MKRILLVTKETSYERHVLRKKDKATTALIAKRDPVVRHTRETYDSHLTTLAEVRRVLRNSGVRTVEATLVKALKLAMRFDLVITVGGDGTLLSMSHLLDSQVPLLGINSAPKTSVGFFCAGSQKDVEQLIETALSGRMRAKTLTRMRVVQNERVLSNRVLNEALFCHASPAVTSRYILSVASRHNRKANEEQKSSGLWVGPAAGSTAAIRSAGGKVLSLSSDAIQYVVREPYAPLGEHLAMTKAVLPRGAILELRSKMRDARLFLDGNERVFKVGFGDTLRLLQSDEPLTVLGLRRK